MAQVQLHGVSKVFPRSVRAVDDLNLDVHDGELLVLVGPSGCGKSTALRLIAGLERPTAGEVRIAGQRVNDTSPARRNVAMVFQHDALLPHLSVRKNLAFGLTLARGGWVQRMLGGHRNGRALSHHEIGERVAEVSKLLAIEPLLDRRPSELSGGERQRVALGRAIVRRPRVFLLDEPLSHLDAPLRSELRAELKQLHCRLAATMIFVTHDQHEAMVLGDRVAVMAGGRVWQTGEPLEIYDRPANRVVAGFLGNPPMNFVQGQLLAQNGRRKFCGSVSVDFPPNLASRLDEYGGKSVTLGVRPEHVHVAPRSLSPANPVPGGSLAMIDMVEALGDSTILRLRLENGEVGNTIAAKIMGRTPLRPGDRVEIVLDPAKCHLFHNTTGENLWFPLPVGEG